MKKYFINLSMLAWIIASMLIVASCRDNDEPEPEPAPDLESTVLKVDDYHLVGSGRWNAKSSNYQLDLTKLEIVNESGSAQGVTVKSVQFYIDGGLVETKPLVVLPLKFSYPLNSLSVGKHIWNLRVVAEYKGEEHVVTIVKNEASKVFYVFNVVPTVTGTATATVEVKGVSTTGETYNDSFTIHSDADGNLRFPASKLSWTPKSGTASTLEVKLNFSPGDVSCSKYLLYSIDGGVWYYCNQEGSLGREHRAIWPNPVPAEQINRLRASYEIVLSGVYEDVYFYGQSKWCHFTCILDK